MHDTVLFPHITEETRRTTFMESISTGPCIRTVNRSTLYDDVLMLYSEECIATEYPMHMKFKDEQGVDCGGVSRDMISAFWEEAYRKMFDGSTLLTPTVAPHTDVSAVFPSVGRFLSHGFLCTGFLPTRVAFPALAGMLLGVGVKIETSVLLDSFMDYISEVDRGVLREALTISRALSLATFPSNLQDNLLTILSEFGCRQIPVPSNLPEVLVHIAKYTFQSTPMLAIVEINSGIPQVHQQF